VVELRCYRPLESGAHERAVSSTPYGDSPSERSSLPGRRTYEGWLSLDVENAYRADVKIRAGLALHVAKACFFGYRHWIHCSDSNEESNALGIGSSELTIQRSELVNVCVRNFLGLHIAHVKLASRHVQECAWLGLVDEATFREFPAAAVPERSERLLPSSFGSKSPLPEFTDYSKQVSKTGHTSISDSVTLALDAQGGTNEDIPNLPAPQKQRWVL
jgi:hypothetical protein